MFGLLLADTPLPTDTILHHLTYFALFRKVKINLEWEIDEEIDAQDRVFGDSFREIDDELSNRELDEQVRWVRQLGGEAIREQDQSRRRDIRIVKKAQQVAQNAKELVKAQAVAQGIDIILCPRRYTLAISLQPDTDSMSDTSDSPSVDFRSIFCSSFASDATPTDKICDALL